MKAILKALYDFDETDKSYILRLSVHKYTDIFDTLDNYPIRKRDIHPDVTNYLEECSFDIPLSRNIKIEFRIRDELRNADLEERTRKGIHNYFLYQRELIRKNSNANIIKSLVYLLVFFILIAFTFTLETIQYPINRVFFRTVLEGLSIGSWVFLWEAIAVLAFKNRKYRYLRKVYQRLSNTHLIFKY